MSAVPLDRDPGSRATSATSRGSRKIRHGDSNRATHRLLSLGAKVVVAAHPTDSIVTEDAMTIAIMLSVAGLGFLCWLAFNLAVHALPFFAAVAGGLFAYHTGAGPIGGAAIAMAAGATTLIAGQFAFARSRSTNPENHDRRRVRAARRGRGLSPCAGNQHHRNAIRRVAARLCDDRRRGGRIDRVGAPCCPAVRAISRACCRVALAAGLRRR